MKFVRYGDTGAEKPGMIDENGKLRDLSAHVSDLAGDILVELEKFTNIDVALLPIVDGNPRIGPCVGGVGKVVAIGLNYSDHAAEAGMKVPTEPILFMKATSSICGPNDPIIIPRGSVKTDWEVELGFVIGKGGKYIKEEDAFNHVAGFCVINDVSEREYQIERQGTWDKGKSADNFCPIGPWLVTPDEFGDPQSKSMWLDVNGNRMQDGSTKTMVYGVAHIISYLSQFMSLHPGDVIATGTPPGVGMGMKPQVYLKKGDIVELSIEGLGQQKQNVIADC